MKLREIISCTKVQEVVGNTGSKIKSICYDSRKASKDSLFVAIRGFRLDGHDFIEDAFCRGARAFVVEKAVDFFRSFDFFKQAVWIKVPSTRKALAEISDFFYGTPSSRLKIVGVTGTKGKTTVTYFLQSIFNKAQIKTARFSTINYDLGGEIIPAPLTTPESVDLQMYLKKCVERKTPYVFMEVSSHSLVLHRVEKINFKAAVFTNLSPEHLDFHRDMEEYLRAKAILFEKMPPEGNAFFNIDDKKSEKIIKKTPCRIFTYGIENKADFRAENIRVEDGRGAFFQVKIRGKKEDFELHIPGIHNIYNALAAIGVAAREGIPVELIKKGLLEVRVIPGRMESVENKANIRIYVDYAHTPSALESVLQALKDNKKGGKLIVVFGCGGDRDRQKRPVMGRIALKMADFVILTSDNPRSENPEDIIREIERGVMEAGGVREKDYTFFVDRKKAIEYALSKASSGDTLLVAGKGHETYQIFKDRKIPFDDREVIRQLLREGNLL